MKVRDANRSKEWAVSGAIYVMVSEGEIFETKEVVTDVVIVDYDREGRVLGVEILGGEE